MSTVIFHNPDCGTSRNTLAIILESGDTPHVVEYLKVGWTKPLLYTLFGGANLTVREALRVSKSPAKELGLTCDNVSDEELLDAMIEHPILVNRPFVITSKGTRLCRPSEKILEILENPLAKNFRKEDGEVVLWDRL